MAAYAIILTASLLVDHRRIDTALLRSRARAPRRWPSSPWPRGSCSPSPPCSSLRGWRSVTEPAQRRRPACRRRLQLVPRVTLDGYVAAGAVGIVCVVLLVLPAFLAARGFAAEQRELSRQETRTFGQRMGIDIALLAVTGIALWQLRLYGAPLTSTVHGRLGLDRRLLRGRGGGRAVGRPRRRGGQGAPGRHAGLAAARARRWRAAPSRSCPTPARWPATSSRRAAPRSASWPPPASARRLPWLSIWTTADQTVTPPDSARLDGAVDVALQDGLRAARPVSHGQLPADPAVVALVLRGLSAAPLTGRGVPGQLVTSFVAKFAHAAPNATSTYPACTAAPWRTDRHRIGSRYRSTQASQCRVGR